MIDMRVVAPVSYLRFCYRIEIKDIRQKVIHARVNVRLEMMHGVLSIECATTYNIQQRMKNFLKIQSLSDYSSHAAKFLPHKNLGACTTDKTMEDGTLVPGTATLFDDTVNKEDETLENDAE